MVVAARQGARLTLDVTPLLDDQWTGIPVFTRRLATALHQTGKVDLRFRVGLCNVPADRVFATIRYASGAFLREELARLSAEEAGLPDAAVPALYPSVKRTFGVFGREASTVHDVSTLFMPENHKPDNVAYHLDTLVRELETNEVTFCVSDATRSALSWAYPSTAGRLVTLYQYVDWPDDFDTMDRNLPRVALGRYAAVIGTLEPRKNLILLLRALEHPGVRDSDLRFVVIGPRGWLLDEFLERLRPSDRSRLILTGFVSEFIKYRLLKHAEFLIFPSIYEGFGIPAVEAMSLGKPVMAARTSSFPEVIGKGGVYFDPFSVDEFASALADMDRPSRLTELGRRALARSRHFNAAKMVGPVLAWLRAK